MQETEFKMDRLSLVGTNGLKAECHRQEGGSQKVLRGSYCLVGLLFLWDILTIRISATLSLNINLKPKPEVLNS